MYAESQRRTYKLQTKQQMTHLRYRAISTSTKRVFSKLSTSKTGQKTRSAGDALTLSWTSKEIAVQTHASSTTCRRSWQGEYNMRNKILWFSTNQGLGRSA